MVYTIFTITLIIITCAVIVYSAHVEKTHKAYLTFFVICNLSILMFQCVTLSIIKTEEHYREEAVKNKAAHWEITIDKNTGEVTNKEFKWGKEK